MDWLAYVAEDGADWYVVLLYVPEAVAVLVLDPEDAVTGPTTQVAM
jgi:hypothetical protein